MTSTTSTPVYCLLFFMLLSLNALAQPVISDVESEPVIMHGTSLTIRGTDFGARNVSKVLFEDFNWGTVGTNVDTIGSPWSISHPGGRGVVQFANYASRGNRGLHTHSVSPDPETGNRLNKNLYQSGLNIQPGDKVYFSLFSSSTMEAAVENCPQQWKIWYHYGVGVPGRPYMGLQWSAAGSPAGQAGGSPQFWIGHNCGSGSSSQTTRYWLTQPEKNAWWQVEAEYMVATERSATDGVLRVWFDGNFRGETQTASWCDDDSHDAVLETGYVYRSTALRHYMPNACAAVIDTLRHDDLVVQVGSWARVHIGNENNWTSCTVREYQPVTSWSDDEIVISVNQGGFMDGESAYLYIVDDSGTYSTSYEIVFGEGSGPDEGPPGQMTKPELNPSPMP